MARNNGKRITKKEDEEKEKGPTLFALAFVREPEGWVIHRLELPADVVRARSLETSGPNPMYIARGGMDRMIERMLQ
ncbi:hypothetical protein MK280_10235 [Myxococcota bacterium]|nr:hypothetical protein [Myxococcota bacterium]